MSDQKGLYDKYVVIKVVDGTVIENCFILKPDSDPAAVKALQAYAAATDNKVLAADLFTWVGKPMQKPLSMEEMVIYADPVWLEFRLPGGHGWYLGIGLATCAVERWYRHYQLRTCVYGKDYRFWRQRPTDEERAAAPWEGTGDADL